MGAGKLQKMHKLQLTSAVSFWRNQMFSKQCKACACFRHTYINPPVSRTPSSLDHTTLLASLAPSSSTDDIWKPGGTCMNNERYGCCLTCSWSCSGRVWSSAGAHARGQTNTSAFLLLCSKTFDWEANQTPYIFTAIDPMGFENDIYGLSLLSLALSVHTHVKNSRTWYCNSQHKHKTFWIRYPLHP